MSLMMVEPIHFVWGSCSKPVGALSPVTFFVVSSLQTFHLSLIHRGRLGPRCQPLFLLTEPISSSLLPFSNFAFVSEASSGLGQARHSRLGRRRWPSRWLAHRMERVLNECSFREPGSPTLDEALTMGYSPFEDGDAPALPSPPTPTPRAKDYSLSDLSELMVSHAHKASMSHRKRIES